MAINWTQEQLIPNTFVGGYQSFTPDTSGFVIASVTGQGELTEAQLGLALVGDSVAHMWVAGGSYIYSQDNSIFWLPGSATFPVAANNTFLLGSFVYTPDSPPAMYFWWIPASAAVTATRVHDQGAGLEQMIARAEQTKPPVPAALQGAGAA